MTTKKLKAVMFSAALILLSVFLYSFISPGTGNVSALPPVPSPNNSINEFITGIMDGGADQSFTYLPQLNTNLWSYYSNLIRIVATDEFRTQKGWDGLIYPYTQDKIEEPVSYYENIITGRLTGNYDHSMRSLFDRPKFEIVCYGQRSDYQAEDMSHVDGHLWFYSFQSPNQIGTDIIDDDPQHGSYQWVRFCDKNTNDPAPQRWVVSRLRANNEQVHNNGNDWRGDAIYSWYIKPRIRIPQNVPIDFPDKKVCEVVVKDYMGMVILDKIIYARHFKDNQGQYDGRYLEEFNFSSSETKLIIPPIKDSSGPEPKYINPFNPNNGEWSFKSRGNNTSPASDVCKADFAVFWYDECDMWLDYIRVDNDVAHNLFSTDPNNLIHQEYETYITEETELACRDPHSNPMFMYVEEFEFNNIPCFAYVNNRIKTISAGYSKNLSLMVDLNYPQYNAHLPWVSGSTAALNAQHVADYLINGTGMEVVFGGPYPLLGTHTYDKTGFDRFDAETYVSKIPNTLPNTSDPMANATAVPTAEYEQWLINEFDNPNDPFSFTNYLKSLQSVSKISGKPFVDIFQDHLWKDGNYIQREPTNEELKMMANVIVTYGAKGIMHFWYGSFNDSETKYGYGLTEPYPNPVPRNKNVYDQYGKFDTVGKINLKLSHNKWGQYLMSFNDADIRSYRYYDPTERNNLVYANNVISEIYTYPNTECPGTGIGPVDDINSRYIQFAKFEPDMTTNYDINERNFMIVNRRCSPHTSSDCGGLRDIKVKFGDFINYEKTGFHTFRNLSLIDLETGTTVATFNKLENNGFPIIDLGWFEPGEGKLYKLAPTFLTGGSLVCDENIIIYPMGMSIGNYDVIGTVFSSGYNIYIGGIGTATFNYAENTGVVLNGGDFSVGTSMHTNFIGKDGARWNGISVSNCNNCTIMKADFKDIKDYNYGLNLTNINNVTITGTNFDYSTGNIQAGGINMYSTQNYGQFININTCSLNMGLSNMEAINVISSPRMSEVDFNDIHISSSYTSQSVGVVISGCRGNIQYSSVIGPAYGLISINSNLELYHNQIYNSTSDGVSIEGAAYSYLQMSPMGFYLIAGMNNLGTGKRNLMVENSEFDVYNGNNTMSITGNESDKHLYGYYPYTGFTPTINVTGNCFYVSGNASAPWHYITLEPGGPQLEVYYGGGNNCSITEDGIAFIVTHDSLTADTVYRSFTFQNNPRDEEDALLQGICVASKKREYDSVIVKSTNYLNNYPDSTGSTEAVEELYFSSLALDSNGNKMLPLKTYYESVILNNPNNTELINIVFYYIQKCKVSLGEYVTAMGGFQQIINQNPYTYEGLIASWDYMSTHLLDSMIGHGGGYNENNIINSSGSFENTEILLIDDFDNVKFNDDDKTIIKQNIEKAFINTKKKQAEEIIALREKANNDDIDAIDKLKIKEALKEAVKVQKPRNMTEYIDIVNKDIKKVFNIGNSDNSAIKKQTNIPTVFKLSQNYPNPFNPITTIKYEIPKDSKVKLVIYDLLGREVKTLVNNEIKSAGYYKVEFNMQNYASGIYFYQIEVWDPSLRSGLRFVDAKKMVLVK